MNGSLVAWKDATVHVATHALHYGTGIFEGIRAYETKHGSARLPPARAHAPALRLLPRLPDGAAVVAGRAVRRGRSRPSASTATRPATSARWSIAARVARARPAPLPGRDVGSSCGSGTRCSAPRASRRASTSASARGPGWRRTPCRRWPRPTGNYANSGLIKMQATLDGYGEAIALDESGLVSEGSGQNLFLVRDKVIYTPAITSSILQGITRDSVITIARDLGLRGSREPRCRASSSTWPTRRFSAARPSKSRRSARSTGSRRRRPARAGHRGAAGALLRHHQGRHAGHPPLADAGAGGAWLR